MEKSKLHSLLIRIISALILAPLVIGAILWGWNTTVVLLLIATALLSWEWTEMVPNKNSSVYSVTYFMTAAATFSFSGIIYPLILMLCTMIFVWRKAKTEKYRKLLVLAVPYITLGVGSLAWFYTLFGPVSTLWLLVAVWSVDIGGYVVGSTVKGPKLAPKISPNKTWAGLIGAILFAVLTSLIFAYFYIPYDVKVYSCLAGFSAVLAVVAQMGDLLESKVKRIVNVKDSSNLIPGHGGMFDRVDGLLFVSPFVLIALYIFYVNVAW